MTPEEIDKSLPEYLADLIVAVRDKARTQALEEAEKVAVDYETHEPDMGDGDYIDGYQKAAAMIAAAIRALQKDEGE